MSPRKYNLKGKRFGRWVVLSYSHQGNDRSSLWNCKCDCGTERPVKGGNLLSGGSSSCGCLHKELTQTQFTTHGHCANRSKSREYKSWSSAVQRCTVPTATGFKDYGGSGITMCVRWLNSFEDFLADMGPRPPRTSLDRYPDKYGDYEPSNCRWATPEEQNNNRRLTPTSYFRNEATRKKMSDSAIRRHVRERQEKLNGM